MLDLSDLGTFATTHVVQPAPMRGTAAAGETLALSTELARLREYVHKGEREALLADVDVLRAELLRVAEALERMQALPQVTSCRLSSALARAGGQTPMQDRVKAGFISALGCTSTRSPADL